MRFENAQDRKYLRGATIGNIVKRLIPHKYNIKLNANLALSVIYAKNAQTYGNMAQTYGNMAQTYDNMAQDRGKLLITTKRGYLDKLLIPLK